MNTYPDHRTLARLPWSLPDNPISWLECTSTCNIYCEGCYRANQKDAHKPLDVIREELEVFGRYRNFDGVSIAGGEPLVHPEIVRIVELASKMGYKPIVNTNGVALTDELLRDLYNAGLRGFTFHIDSKQKRPGWKNKTEIELNELRLEFAERAARMGDISVAFNSTVYEDTLAYAPDIVEWAAKHIDKVHVVVFIAYRQAAGGKGPHMDFYVGDKQIEFEEVVYNRPTGVQRLDIASRDVVAEIRKRFPDFAPSAYLNGSEKADSLKWLLTTRVGDGEKIHGYFGPKFQELAQSLHHFRHGRFMAYAPPHVLSRGKSTSWATSFFDEGAKGAFRSWAGDALRNPTRLFKKSYMQSVMIIQPIDVLADGRMNMCDACPDITVHEGELVWSCRLEELLKYGGFARGVCKKHAEMPAEPEVETVPTEDVPV